jgi:hypothetical protein
MPTSQMLVRSSSPSNNPQPPVMRTGFSRLKITAKSQVCPDVGRERHLRSPFVLPAFHFPSIPSSTTNRAHYTIPGLSPPNSLLRRLSGIRKYGALLPVGSLGSSPLYTPQSYLWHRPFSPQVCKFFHVVMWRMRCNPR